MNYRRYDAIIIGSGFGGSAAAYALSKAGLKTVLLEKGGWAKRDDTDWNPREILIERRYKSDSPVFVNQNSNASLRKVFLNEVVGGNSVFFGGAAVRFREKDFNSWPVSYDEFESFYTEAEQILEVSGETSADPFDPPRNTDYFHKGIPLSKPSQRIFNAAEMLGFRPFKLPLAINFNNNSRKVCIQCTTCDGYPCKIEAKNDAATTLLAKAQQHNCEIITGVIVDRVCEKSGTITGIEYIDKKHQKRHSISGRIVIVSAGTLHSPGILLRSRLENYPNSKKIGTHLMRHCSAIVTGVFPFKTNPMNEFQKQVGITHFYEDFREKLNTSAGMIQDIYMPTGEIVKYYIPTGLKTASLLAASRCQNLICIAEDDPVFDNKVVLSGQKDMYGIETITVKHRFTGNDLMRRDYLVHHARKILRRSGSLITLVHEIDEKTPPTFSHAVGSVRFGSNSRTSVLDKNCTFHGINNLFVLDGSFMQTSAGVNPSLTITANALRVSDHIIRTMNDFS